MANLQRVAALVIAVALTITVMSAGVVAQGSRDLIVGLTVDPQTLDPRFVFSTQGISIMNHVYEHLVQYDASGGLRPGLAERWELPNPNTIRFHLRKGVRFQNGEPLDAEAVKYTIESVALPGSRSPQRPGLAAIERVDIVDQHTVDVRLNAPAARTILLTLTYWGLILPPKFAKESGDRFTTAYGTGPYRLVEYRPGERLVLQRNPRYWGRPGGSQRIVFRFIPDPATRVAAFERGEIDIAINFPVDQMARLKSNSELVFFSRPTVRIAFLGFRVDRPPFDDARLRRALAMAVNSAEINNSLLGGRGRVANSVIAPEAFGYSSKVASPPYDPAQARQLLAQAGHPNLRIRMGLSNGRFVNDRQIGEAVAAYLGQVGVRVDLEAPEFGTFLRELAGGKFDAYVISWAFNTLDPDFALTPIFHERFALYTAYKSAEASQLLDRARGTVDTAEASRLYEALQQVLLRDLPWVPLVRLPDVIGFRRNVQGVQLRPDEVIMFVTVTKR